MGVQKGNTLQPHDRYVLLYRVQTKVSNWISSNSSLTITLKKYAKSLKC